MNAHLVAIIGGGISGLSTAYELSRLASREKIPLRITLLEAQDRFGGVIRTFDQERFTAEAAADAFYGGGPWGSEAVEFCGSLGLSEELIEASASFRRFYIFKNKKPVPFPNMAGLFDPAALFWSPLLGFSAKARFLAEPWVPREKKSGDESLGHFIRRRLGAAFYREAVRPVIRGVYMADPDDLSLEAVFPGLRKKEQTYGSLANAALADVFKKKNAGSDRFWNFKNGLESLTGALVRALNGCELRTVSPVRRWKREGTRGHLVLESGEKFRADAVCLAMTAADAAPLLREADAALSQDLTGIRYDSVLTFNFVFKKEDLLGKIPDSGFFVPAHDATYPFSSLKGFDPTPGGEYRRLRVFISEAMLPEIFREEDGTAEKKILRALETLLGIRSSPAYVTAERYRKALPCYETGHGEKIARIEAGLRKHPGLFLTGNGFRGFGITECIYAARNKAQEILVYCQNLRSGTFAF